MNDSIQSTRRENEEAKEQRSIMENALLYFFDPKSQKIEDVGREIMQNIVFSLCMIVFFLMMLLRTLLSIFIEAVFIPLLVLHMVFIIMGIKNKKYTH